VSRCGATVHTSSASMSSVMSLRTKMTTSQLRTVPLKTTKVSSAW